MFSRQPAQLAISGSGFLYSCQKQTKQKTQIIRNQYLFDFINTDVCVFASGSLAPPCGA